MPLSFELVQRRIARAVIAASGLPESNVLWSQNKAPRPAADGIVMRLMGIQFVADSWLDVQDNPLTFDDLAVSAVDDVGDAVTVVGHGLSTGDGPVRVGSTLTVPGGLTADTDYWVVAPDEDTLQFCESFVETGGADVDGAPSGNPVTVVDLTSAGSGVITISSTEDTLRAGQEVLYVSRGTTRCVLNLECHTVDAAGDDMALALLHRTAARLLLPAQVETLNEAGVGIVEIDPVRAVRGRLDAILFEPRATLDIQLAIVSEETEAGTIIQTTDITPTIGDVEGDEERFPVGGG